MNQSNIYDDLFDKSTESVVGKRTDLKNIYFNFFKDFHTYLVEFMKVTNHELVVAEMMISTEPIHLFDDILNSSGRYVTFKNQGQIECYLSTSKLGGFRLDSGEKEKMWVNAPVTVVTISGMTSLGIIQS